MLLPPEGFSNQTSLSCVYIVFQAKSSAMLLQWLCTKKVGRAQTFKGQ